MKKKNYAFCNFVITSIFLDTNGTTLIERDTNTHIHSTHTQPYDNSVKSTYIDTREIGRIIFGQRKGERERERHTVFIEAAGARPKKNSWYIRIR